MRLNAAAVGGLVLLSAVAMAGLVLLSLTPTSDRPDVARGVAAREAELFKELRIRVEKVGAIDARLGGQLHEDTEFLQSRWFTAFGKTPSEYLDSFESDIQLIDYAVANRAAATLAEAIGNIHLKRMQCQATETGLGDLVTVTVRTVSASEERPGHFVWYVERGWRSFSDRYKRFENMSSPTARRMAPGNWLIWAQGTSESERAPVTVGGEGQRQQSVDIRIP